MNRALFASIFTASALAFADSGESRPRLEATDLSVFTRVYNGYSRAQSPIGGFVPETYTLGKGTYIEGNMADASIDELPFVEIAKILTPALRAQNYLPSDDPAQTKLLIVVSWGTSVGSRETPTGNTNQDFYAAKNASELQKQVGFVNRKNEFEFFSTSQNHVREVRAGGTSTEESLRGLAADSMIDTVRLQNFLTDQSDMRNARLLGYAEDLSLSDGQLIMYNHRNDLLSDIQYNRYFVILQAYDLQEMVKGNKQKLLWTTRFSIRQRGNSFKDRLDTMSRQAAKYFGKPTKNIVRNLLPDVKVEVGEPKVLGYEENTKH